MEHNMAPGDWVKIQATCIIEEHVRAYGKLESIDERGAYVQFPVQDHPGTSPARFTTRWFQLSEVTYTPQLSGSQHISGKPWCREGSLSSGGNAAFCQCKDCKEG